MTPIKIAPHLDPYTVSPATYLHNEGETEVTVAHLVATTVVMHSGRVLLLQRANKNFLPYLWELPGGKCDAEDESVVVSGARELREETGLVATEAKDVVGRYDWIDHGEKWKSVIFWMDVETADGGAGGCPSIKTVPREHASFVWASKEDVLANQVGDVKLIWTNQEHKETVLKVFEKA